MQTPSQLEHSILKTLCYFDLLEYPLTATEIWKWLYKPSKATHSLQEVQDVLEQSEYLRSRIGSSEAFYFLAGRDLYVPERKKRNLRVHEQMRKTQRIVRLLRLFPPIKMIAVSSSLPFGNVKEHSDIDLFIITRRRNIWQARLLAAGLLKLLGKRPDERVKRDRFCLTFFVTEDALDISSAATGSDDILYHYFFQSLMPVYDPDQLYEAFLAENAWVEKIFPGGVHRQKTTMELGRPGWLRAIHRMYDVLTLPIFGGPWKGWPARLQIAILPDSLKSLANVDSRVVISDSMLKFHNQDKRKELIQKWSETLAQYEAR